jgi:branched-chain amino acid transport system permease protein
VGLGLLVFGAEGARTPPFSEGTIELGNLSASAQSLWVIVCSFALIVLLYLAFERTVYGKALRATAVNRLGAKLMGIPTEFAGRLSFFLCALIGALSGILIAPITTIYYDTGFNIGLKGFVGAIIGGLASYPVAALGALRTADIPVLGQHGGDVFTVIIPVLLVRCCARITSRRTNEASWLLIVFSCCSPHRWYCPSSRLRLPITSACMRWWRSAWCC